jgi:hypothetical protein
VPEEERDLYAAQYHNPIYTYPDRIRCHCDAMQFVRDTVSEKRVFFLDDDATRFVKPYRETLVKISGEYAVFDILNLTAMAMDLGVPLYGFSTFGTVKFYRANKPFTLSGFFPAACMGFNNTTMRSEFKLREDVDFCLQALLDHRIVLISNLMGIVFGCDNNTGGNMGIKSKRVNDYWLKKIKDKWGKYVQFIDKSGHGNNFKVQIHVARQQELKQ